MLNPQLPNQPNYMPQLDGLRALAVMCVAYEHWTPEIRHFGLPWGAAGVQLFFVLSGFLITGILFKCHDYSDRSYSLKAFYARRFLRIFPLYYVVLAVTYVLNVPGIHDSIWWHVFYLSNFYFLFENNWTNSFGHFWSLSVEEQFYLFWPVMFLWVPRRYLLRTTIGLMLVGVISRFTLPLVFPDARLIGVLPNMNLDALGLGAMLAVLGRDRAVSFTRYCNYSVLAFVLLVALRLTGFEVPFHAPLERLSMLLFFTWLIHAASGGFGGVTGRVLELPPLLYLGKISYGLYILHNFAPAAVRWMAATSGYSLLNASVPRLIAMVIFTVAFASLSWFALEAPLNSLKSRFPYRRPTLPT